MSVESELKLVELICTRICHDLIGSVGALSNGIELLDDCDEDFLKEIQKLLADSSNALTAKLKLFRIVFGQSRKSESSISTVKSLLEPYVSVISRKNAPISLNINLSRTIEKNTYWEKLLMVLAIIGCDSLPRGGIIEIKDSAECIFCVSAIGKNACMNKEATEVMEQVHDNYEQVLENASPQVAPVVLAEEISCKLGVDMKVKTVFDRVDFCIKLKP